MNRCRYCDPLTKHSSIALANFRLPSPPWAISLPASLAQHRPIKTSRNNGEVPGCPVIDKNVQTGRSAPRSPDFRALLPAPYAEMQKLSLENVHFPILTRCASIPARRCRLQCLEIMRSSPGISMCDLDCHHPHGTVLKQEVACYPAPHSPHVLHASYGDDPRSGYLCQVIYQSPLGPETV